MAAHIDILDQPESLKNPLMGSIGLHVLVFGSLALYNSMSGQGRQMWGDPRSLAGGAVGITPVSQIPLPSRGGLVNPLANDTESSIPRPPQPKEQERPAPKPDPAEVAIRTRKSARRPSEIAASRQRFRQERQETPNQVYSSVGRAVSSPMFGGQMGSSGVSVGAGSPFGNRFGYYVDLLRQRVAGKWRTEDVDPRLQTAPPVMVTFEIRRDGSIRNQRLIGRSGNSALDYSALRAVSEASPFPPLPAGFERDEATIEFWFQLKR